MTELVQAVTHLQRHLSTAEELADAIGYMLAAAGIVVPQYRPRPQPRPDKVSRATTEPTGRRPRLTHETYLALARPGVGSVSLRPSRDGHVAVSIDCARPFDVPNTLAQLLKVLTSVRQRDTDGFPVFCPYADIQAAMQAATGRPYTKRAITVAINRLRASLHANGCVSPMLLETTRNRGVRFRLRLPERPA